MSSALSPFGPLRLKDGRVRFRLWAPKAQTVELALGDGFDAMAAQGDGWYTLEREAAPGTRYRFRIDGGLLVPDPGSHFQPDDVNGASELIDHGFLWMTPDWRGRPWREAAICELHVGAFSALGDYRGLIGRLDHLVEAGFTAIELMPIADFAGQRNWGYDGVLPFAPDSAYGRPEQLKQLIDAAHRRGLMVLLDVVYNHFGPEGNYLGAYAPPFFTEDFTTPWGQSIDYRQPYVREFAVQNALHWLETYRFDGLRLDAVHAIKARGEPSILDAIREAAEALGKRQQRHIHLVLENDDNAASLLVGPQRAGFRAQWNDDYHHAWHVLLTGERHGYYQDYQKPFQQLVKAMTEGFVYQGEASQHRDGAIRGEDSTGLPPTAFVDFLQNHDQIGNRPFGERLETMVAREANEAALAILLLAPHIPLLFMGEEWGCTQPFPFFCDFHGELAQAVREGRRREFKAHFDAHGEAAAPPDALEPGTFKSTRLRWQDMAQPRHQARLAIVSRLLRLRRQHLVPHLDQAVQTHVVSAQAPLLQIEWRFGDAAVLTLCANLSNRPLHAELQPIAGDCLWGEVRGDGLPPWHVGWFLAEPAEPSAP